VGQLELAADALLAQVLLDQTRVLDRRPDLIRDGRDELAVAGGERVLPVLSVRLITPIGVGTRPGDA